MAVTLRRRRFTLDEYHRMGETGILGPDARVELIEGEIIEMSPIGSRHAGTVARIQRLPEPPDVRLLIEVADSSLPYDRRTKFPLYACSGVTEAWLVDLDAGRLEMTSVPLFEAYSPRPWAVCGSDIMANRIVAPELSLKA